MNSGTSRRLVKKLLTAGLIAMLPVMLQPAVAQSIGGINGTVFTGETGIPLTGARIHLMQVGTKTTFTSNASDGTGAFNLNDLPPASYEAAVEFEGGLYLLETPVIVTGGQAVHLNLSIPVLVDAAGQSTPKRVTGSAGFFASPLAATVMVVGTALSVGALVDSLTHDDVASPFQALLR